MLASEDQTMIHFIYPFNNEKELHPTLVFTAKRFVKQMVLDIPEIKALYPPTRTVLINVSNWAIKAFSEYPVSKIPVPPKVGSNEVDSIIDVLDHIQRFISRPDGELRPTARYRVENPIFTRSLIFQASDNTGKTVLAIASSGLYIPLEGDYFDDSIFPDGNIFCVKIDEPPRNRKCIKIPTDEFAALISFTMSPRANASYLFTESPVAAIQKKFMELIPAKAAMTLVSYGAQLAGKELAPEIISESLNFTPNGYLASLPNISASSSFNIKGGPIAKLLVQEMNKSPNKRVPVDSFLSLLYQKLKIRISESALPIILAEIQGFIVYQNNIIVYYV